MAMHGIYDKIYSSSPIWFQNLMISVYGCKLKRYRYGGMYHEYLEYLKNRDCSDVEKEREVQNAEFLRLLHHAVEKSPFYRRFYKDIDIVSIKSVDDITKLPILDKETLRQNIMDVYTVQPNGHNLSFTGGTTGKSLQVVVTKEDAEKRMAILDAFKHRHGFEMCRMKSARFNGKNIIPVGQKKKVFWRDNLPMKQRIYSSFYLSQDNIPYHVSEIPKEKSGKYRLIKNLIAKQ